jgi:hypothetical protein
MGVHVEGLREITRAMERAGVDVEELKDVMGSIAAEASRVMQGFTPTRTGALRNSIRGNRAKGKAEVTAGKARVPYAAPIFYGWPKRNIKPSRTIERTDEVMDDRVAQMLADGWNEIAKRHGLA